MTLLLRVFIILWLCWHIRVWVICVAYACSPLVFLVDWGICFWRRNSPSTSSRSHPVWYGTAPEHYRHYEERWLSLCLFHRLDSDKNMMHVADCSLTPNIYYLTYFRYRHSDLPYQWQWRNDKKWEDCDTTLNSQLEENFCKPETISATLPGWSFCARNCAALRSNMGNIMWICVCVCVCVLVRAQALVFTCARACMRFMVRARKWACVWKCVWVSSQPMLQVHRDLF